MTEVRIDPGELRGIRTLQDVVGFLYDELDWPIDSGDLEESSFDYTAEELGIPSEQMPKLKSLRQLRPLVAGQPWGIFFLEFTGPRLPITPLRRLLRALVTKKRASGDGTRKAWDLNDLLFVITTDTGDSVELHFIAFVDGEGPGAEIRSLPWRPEQSPEQHLRRLAVELLPRLAWPDETDDADTWRSGWREAFRLRHGEAISSSNRLAERMAETAHALRERVFDALVAEQGGGVFSTLLAEVRAELVADVDEARFADMCAQTLVYGLLGSRISDPEAFGASPTLSAVPLSNPFLAAFFEQVHDQLAELDLEATGLEKLVADLRESNVEAVLDQFQSTAKGGDPVIHFYEDFLARYDRQMRADAGAFYTPQPVVRFMVQAVDGVLKSRFGLRSGVADEATWAEVADRAGVEIPAGVMPGSPFISMLDPATGTGTFLVEWLRQAQSSFTATHPDGAWSLHLKDVVLPSMHAFELMLAPYAIAHLKVALTLENQDAAPGGACILLTDTLDYPAAAGQFETLEDPVAVEGKRAAELKQSERFTVIIGNPPYDREQHAIAPKPGAAAKRKGGVVRYGVPGIPPLLNDVLEPLQSAGLGQHAKNVYNDYVYFWRWATWQATERRRGPGVVAFITASSYLDGKSFGGLRSSLRRAFDELWLVDLGGEGRAANTEQNVFDILTPVVIAIGVRCGGGEDCTVRYRRLGGSRVEKYAALGTLTLAPEDFDEVQGAGLDRLTPRTDSPYRRWPSIADLFPLIHSGSQLKRTWPIGPTRAVLEARWLELTSLPSHERATALKETRDRKVDTTPGPLLTPNSPRLRPVASLSPGDPPEAILRYGYKSFDRQWVIADNRVADFPRPLLWKTASEAQVYFSTATAMPLGRGPVLMASPDVPDMCHFRGSFGSKDIIPMWRDATGEEPNVDARLVEALGDALGGAVEPPDLFAYVYGLCGTSAFSDRFREELAEGADAFRVPLTLDQDLFAAAVDLGRELLWRHTFGERFGLSPGALPTGSAQELEPVDLAPRAFTYDAATECLQVGKGSFGPVSREVWDFEVSGLKILRSWLGYRMIPRKGKKSSPLDDIAPAAWTFSGELLGVLAALEFTVGATPRAAALLDKIVAGDVLSLSVASTQTSV